MNHQCFHHYNLVTKRGLQIYYVELLIGNVPVYMSKKLLITCWLVDRFRSDSYINLTTLVLILPFINVPSCVKRDPALCMERTMCVWIDTIE